MSEEQDAETLARIIPDAVREAYTQEEEFIAAKVRAARESGDNWFRQLTEWIPYIDEPMTEQEIGPAAATSDVNRDARKRQVIAKIEARLGPLDDETKSNIRKDIEAMYNGDYSDG